MSFGMILDLLIMACGVYIIYWAVQMKSTNKIPEMLVGKGFPTDRAKDPEGFIKFTFPFTFAAGALLLVAGTLGALGITALYPMADIALRLATVVVVIGYGMLLMKAQKKYLVGLKK